ncbi:unnamed protein product [Miscanthus lutarioriparius]|uniref:Uncharacterized protein n=1 Tax=Miscanthus lutarioriparius TaxID=422564 RepID=A0A811QMF7_9POAL|nr:unnamed protein product [Miscanthus lutarioriparius]
MDKTTDLELLNRIKLDDQDLELLNRIELVSFEDDDEPMQVEEDLERRKFSSLQKETYGQMKRVEECFWLSFRWPDGKENAARRVVRNVEDLTKEEYMQAIPWWAQKAPEAWELAAELRWCNEAWKVKSDAARACRQMMRGASHRQGNCSHARWKKKMVLVVAASQLYVVDGDSGGESSALSVGASEQGYVYMLIGKATLRTVWLSLYWKLASISVVAAAKGETKGTNLVVERSELLVGAANRGSWATTLSVTLAVAYCIKAWAALPSEWQQADIVQSFCHWAMKSTLWIVKIEECKLKLDLQQPEREKQRGEEGTTAAGMKKRRQGRAGHGEGKRSETGTDARRPADPVDCPAGVHHLSHNHQRKREDVGREDMGEEP